MWILLLSWSFYFFLHSWLASPVLKNRYRMVFTSLPFRYYRLAYNIFSLAGLVLLVFFQVKIKSSLVVQPSVFTISTGALLMTGGLVIMVIAGLNYDLKSFFGVTDEKKAALKTNNLNRLVRHPLYSGTTLFFLGICITWPFYKNLFLFLVYFLYLCWGMYLEEKKLIQLYREEYLQYRSKVKKIIPGLW